MYDIESASVSFDKIWLILSGLLNLYDLRKGVTPTARSVVETSHYDPVYDLTWLQSKTGTEAVTVSSDGRLMIWDVRDMSAPRDSVWITDGSRDNAKVLGGVSLEWMLEAGPTKYLVGTEMGMIVSCQNKPKKPVEVSAWFGNEDKGGEKGGGGKHYGPVYDVKRNPFHCKYFLSIGDWSCRMWMEDLKNPMLMTPYSPSYLSAAAWSPTRAGVFFLARHDGYLDIWDYHYRMNDVSLTQKVSDYGLTTMAVQQQGSFIATGDSGGVITLLQLCDGLVHPQHNEKNIIGALFERETKREKNLEALRKHQKTHNKDGHAEDDSALRATQNNNIDEKAYVDIENKFFSSVGMEGDNLGTTAYLSKKTEG